MRLLFVALCGMMSWTQGRAVRRLSRRLSHISMYSAACLLAASVLGLTLGDGPMLNAQAKRVVTPFHLDNLLDFVVDVACSADGKYLAVSGWLDHESRLLVFAYPSGRLHRIMKSSDGRFKPIAFSPDGKLIAAAFQRNPCLAHVPTDRIQIWDVAEGKRLMDRGGHWSRLSSLCFTPDGKNLVTGGREDKQIKIWDVSGRILRANFRLPNDSEMYRPQKGGVPACDLAPLFIDVKTPKNTRSMSSVALFPDGKTAAIANYDKYPLFLDLTTGKKVKPFTMPPSTQIEALALSPDGRRLATRTWSEDGPVLRVWDCADPSKQRQVLPKHNYDLIYSIQFSADGKALVIYGMRGTPEDYFNTLTIWDVATSRVRFTVEGGKAHGEAGDQIWSHTVSPDGKLIAAFMADGKPPRLRFWELATGKELIPGEK
jgi:WD40 repeat protein